MDMIAYPNLRSFMKRHGLTIGDIAKAVGKSYPSIHQKITKRSTKHGKIAMFDIDEAKIILNYIIATERTNLQKKYGESWQKEWNTRWGHIDNWFNYIFFDEVVSNETNIIPHPLNKSRLTSV